MSVTMKAEEARSKFSDIVNRAAFGHERIVLTRHGRSMAAVIPMDDLELLEKVIAKLEDLIDVEEAKAALKEAEEKGTIPWEQLKAELGL